MRPGRRTLVALAAWLGLASGGCGPDENLPAPVPWDRVACAECRMLVGDPRFAAQLLGAEGERLHFDDPGCLLLHLAEKAAEPRGIWVHHAREDRWLRLEEAGFVPMGPSPMGHDLGAVERHGPGALDAEEALGRIRGGPGREGGAG